MLKIKRRIIVMLIIIICIPINVFAKDLEDEYEEVDYIWLEEEITKAKEQDEIVINSKNAVIYDRESKTIIWGKDENKKVPMASTTKIMTAIIMLENITNFDKKIKVSKQAATTGGSRLGLKIGDIITYNDLLYGLMLCSGNDAAVQIAISVAGDIENFAKLMNKKAKEMGLVNSNFVVPHGLDNVNHYTTAAELAIMADYGLNIQKFQEVVATKTYTVTINGYPKTINNTNELLGYLNGVNGVKTGFTNRAGRCLVTSVERNGFKIITVVLGADTKKIRTKDSIKLIEWTYKNYELVDLEEIVNNLFEDWKRINEKRIKIYKGRDKYGKILLGTRKYKKYPVKSGEKNNINVNINSNFKLEAPVEKNKKIGNIKVSLNTTEIMDIDILNRQKIDRKTYIDYLIELLLMYQNI